MTLATVAINGRPLESYGLVAIALDEWLAPPQYRYGTAELVGRLGTVPLWRGGSWTPRTLSLGVQTTASTLTTSRDALGQWYAALQGLLEVTVIDGSERSCYGVFEGATGSVHGIKLLSPALQSVGRIVCHDPLYYDRSPQYSTASAGGRAVVPCGTAPGRVRFAVAGAASNPTFLVRDRAGTPLAQMRFELELDSTQWLVIDRSSSTLPVAVYTAGVAAPAFDALHPDDTFLTFDPTEGPTLEVSSGSLWVQSWRGWLV